MDMKRFLEDELGLRGKLAPTGWFRACCPFHQERSPSFAVNTRAPYNYNCLACGAGGQLVQLTAHVKAISLSQAVEFVREHVSIDVELGRSLLVEEKESFISPATVLAFTEMLPQSRAWKYCAGRGVPGYVLNAFNAGYEPLNRRLLIPLYAVPELNKVVGFDTRVFDVGDVEKLTDVLPGWRRKSVIFPVNGPCAESIIVVEGFFDAARVWQWLVESGRATRYTVAAICGNRPSNHHAAFVSRFERVVCGFDDDAGGQRAAQKLRRLIPERPLYQLHFDASDPGESNKFEIKALI